MPASSLRHRLGCALAASASVAAAQPASPGPTPDLVLEPVVVQGHYDNAVGSSDAASQGRIRHELLKSRPALRPGEVLEFVPGLIVTQHSGDGKANQYFLRGFNLDHGTDFASHLDGMPLNLRTHGHGQGYTDLNVLIPELVERIDYRKGPYFARDGDFALAGSADIVYRRRLEQPFAQFTLGQRGHRRAVLGGSAALAGERTLLGAIELMRNDGPWTEPEQLRKVNAVLRLSEGSAAEGWSSSLMAYDARWNATDQVPLRAIVSGRIGRFDAIDASDGGDTARFSASGEWHRRSGDGGTALSAWALRSRLHLYSNLTYALDRPADGDQGRQSDTRTAFGLSARRDWTHRLLGRAARTEIGAQWQHDRIRVGLHDTVARQRTAAIREDAVRETSLGLHAETTVEWTGWLRTIAGLRADAYRFRVDSALPANSGRGTAGQLSPKFSAVLGPWARTEFFVNAGRGFHSNDARGTTMRIDPRSGDPAAPVPGLVAGRGGELGLRTEALPGLQSSLALWGLESDSELIYVGDAGTTEAHRPSRRRGIEWNNRWIPRSWLLLDADLAWTRARFANADPAGDRIPGAVARTASLAVTLREMGPWLAGLQWRYLGPRPLIEDGSVRSPSTLLTNLRLGHRFSRDLELTLDVFNLLDRKVDDIRYFYESRLPGEAAPVADVHLHPAEPRTVRLTVQARF